ncbi:alkaline phytoceramidase [Rhizobacter sp. AJA081-3]|uniref:hypothetical protein n=1 Tax=Rhizobacter sp. AJA081-3 TaxID=2753607 RepID=UPI001ADF954B|nr:hypothetical protein [Rhizobacter sp. AJA081-3]QTN23934.1 alkaline phytoceramidase [Rhizobacter sp. AJA081-3]
MTTSSMPSSTAASPRRDLVLLAVTALLALALLLHGPIAQWASYHAFADQRQAWGIPHAADVLSNLPFAFAGLWALWTARGEPRTGAWLPWRAFAIALVATAAGSAAYHWAPHNASLAFDRLPIAWACAALLCVFLAERRDPRWARPAVLATALALASASVVLWWASELAGRSDLRAYLFVQFLPMLIVPAALWMRLPRQTHSAVRDSAWWGVLAGYAIAKGFELADHALLDALGGWVSGHTLKHLAAAAAAGWILHAAQRAARLSCGNPR